MFLLIKKGDELLSQEIKKKLSIHQKDMELAA